MPSENMSYRDCCAVVADHLVKLGSGALDVAGTALRDHERGAPSRQGRVLGVQEG